MKKSLLFMMWGTSIFFAGLIFAQNQEEVNKMSENLHWLGHSSFRFDGSKIIYFDPWKLPKNSKKADLVFISREHFDHFSPEDVSAISSSETVIISDRSVAGSFKEKSIAGRSRTLARVKRLSYPKLKSRRWPAITSVKNFILKTAAN